MGAVILRECPAYTTHPIKIISVWSQAFSSVLSAGIDPGRIGSGSSPISHCTSFPTFTSYLQAFTNIPINHFPHVMFNHISYKRILRQRSIRALTVDGQKGREKKRFLLSGWSLRHCRPSFRVSLYSGSHSEKSVSNEANWCKLRCPLFLDSKNTP